MDSPLLPADFPPLLAMAERDAREFFAAGWPTLTWGLETPGMERVRRAHVATHAALLRDLSRPQARDAWARWLAEALGFPGTEATAPAWTLFDEDCCWLFATDHENMVFAATKDTAQGFGCDGKVVLTLAGVTDPAAALLAAVLAVAGEVPDAGR